MSKLQDLLKTHLVPGLKEWFGDSITYQHSAGGSQSVQAIVNPQNPEDKTWPPYHAVVKVFSGDLTPAPVNGDRVVFLSVTYQVVDVQTNALRSELTCRR